MKTLTVAAFVFLTAVSSAVCQDTLDKCNKSAATQLELTQCAGDEAKRADAELNRTYQQLLSKAKKNSSAVAKIRAAQRAWIAFRDAQLQAVFPKEGKRVSYGSMFPMCYANIAAEMTRQRTAELKRMVESWSDEFGSGCEY